MTRGPNGEHPYLLAKQLAEELTKLTADPPPAPPKSEARTEVIMRPDRMHIGNELLDLVARAHAEYPHAALYVLAVVLAAVVGYALGAA